MLRCHLQWMGMVAFGLVIATSTKGKPPTAVALPAPTLAKESHSDFDTAAEADVTSKSILIDLVVFELPKDSRLDLQALKKKAAFRPSFPNSSLQILSPDGREKWINELTSIEEAVVVSRPRIVTTNGRNANIQVGNQIEIPAPEGKELTKRMVGLDMDFRPEILKGDRIGVSVDLEYSKIDKERSVSVNGKTVPGIEERVLQTAFEIQSGETALFTGPGESRLVILISPQIIQPNPVPAPKDLPKTGPLALSTPPLALDFAVAPEVVDGQELGLIQTVFRKVFRGRTQWRVDTRA